MTAMLQKLFNFLNVWSYFFSFCSFVMRKKADISVVVDGSTLRYCRV